MKNSLTLFMNNEKKSSSLRSIIYIILFLFIIEQIFTISSFVYKYTSTHDYGKLMEKTCDTSYIEFETDRFQICNNIMNLVLQNDNNDTHYNLIILIIIIIVVISICSLYILIFLESISGGNFMSYVTKFAKAPKGALLVSSMMNGWNSFLEKTFLDKLFIIFKILLSLYIVLIIPLTIAIQYIYDFDISPFVNSYEHFIIHAIFLLPILFFTYTNASISVFFSIIFFILFLVLFFYMMLAIDIYIKQADISRQANKYDNSSNELLKEMQFTITYFDDIENDNTNIIGKFIQEILGFNDVGFVANLKNGSLPISDNIVNFKGLVFFIFILLIVLGIVYIMLSYKPNGMELFGMLDAGSFDADSIYYFAIVPLLIVFIILLIVVATKEYNTYINKFILYKPNNLYKRNIYNVNREFNKIIENDGANIQNNSVCKNVANTIHMVLYSNIFQYFGSEIFIPEFEYNSSCEIGDYIDYNKLREYDFDKYIYNNQVNIFFHDGKCNSVNNDFILAAMKTSIITYDQNLNKNDYDEFKELFINKLKFAINNVQNKLIYDGTRDLQLSNEYKANNTITEIKVPIGQSYTFDEDTLVIIKNVADEYIKYMESIHKLCITILQALIRCNNIDDFTANGYKDIMKNLDYTIRNTTNGNYSLNIKKSFVNKFSLITKQLFSNINKLLSQRLRIKEDNNKLAKYIIKNYNFYQFESYKKYLDNSFAVIQSDNYKNIIPEQNENILNEKEIITSLYTQIRELNEENDDRKIEMKKKELKTNIMNLQNAKRIYIDSYNNANNDDYYLEILHDYCVEYIDRNIQLHNNVYKSIENRNNIGIYSYDFKFDNTTSNIFDTSSYSISKNDLGINFEVYSSSYNSILQDFNNKYEVLSNIANDRYKIQEENHNYRELQKNEELYSKDVSKMAYNTSSNIYTLFAVYFIALYIAHFVK